MPVTELEGNMIHRFNVGDALRRSAARSPQQRAIHFQGRDITYAALDRMANQVARVLTSSGIRAGDAVALYAMNSPEYVAIFFACARIGVVLVPINLMFTADDVDYVFEKTHVKALMVEPVFLPKVKRSPAIRFVLDGEFKNALAQQDSSVIEYFVDHDAPFLVIFTSGTTARPKGVVLTQLNFYAYLLSAFAEFGMDRSRRYLLALPMFHIAGLVNMFSCFASGCDSVIIPLPKPEPILHGIAVQKINTVALPATVWVGLLQLPEIETADLSSLTHPFVFQYLPTPVFQRWRQLAPQAEWVNCWGQTETTALGSSTAASELGSMLSSPDPIGMQHLTLELRIVDEDMKDVVPGKPGEIVVRGPSLSPGYFEDPAANEALYRGGWHHTGDIAYRDEHGWLYFLDRKKDMIKSGGENVSSQEVEEVLSQHPGVAEVAVIGLPDPYWIEKVVACVVPLPGANPTEDELLTYTRTRLASFKVPKQIHVISDFPKNPTGKVLKRVLRERFSERDLSAAVSMAAQSKAMG